MKDNLINFSINLVKHGIIDENQYEEIYKNLDILIEDSNIKVEKSTPKTQNKEGVSICPKCASVLVKV